MDELRNFVTAQHLQSHWKILPAELLDFIKSGLPAYRQTGIVIEAEELLPEKTLFDIQKGLVLRAVKNSEARKCRRFINLANIPSSFHPHDFKGTIVIAPPNTPATTETLSNIDTEAKRIFEKLSKRKDNQSITGLNTFLFKRKEINQFAQLHELKLITETDEPAGEPAPKLEQFTPETPDRPTPAQDHTDPEAFMRSMSVAYLSNTEVSIKVGNKTVEQCTRQDMGFDRKYILWPLFIKVLEDREYHVGIYSKDKDPIKNKNYYKLVKQLSNVSKQFVSFINVKYSESLPEGFNIFQNMKGHERAGIYKTKFHIVDSHDIIQSTDIKSMLQNQTLNKLRTLSEQLKREKNKSNKDQLLKDFGVYAEHAVKKGWINESQLRHLIPPPDEDAAPEDAMSLAEQVEDINTF